MGKSMVGIGVGLRRMVISRRERDVSRMGKKERKRFCDCVGFCGCVVLGMLWLCGQEVLRLEICTGMR